VPNIEVQLPARIGEPAIIAGQAALVIAWRLVRSRFLLGGSLDRAPQLSLQVLTEQGEELWLEHPEVARSISK